MNLQTYLEKSEVDEIEDDEEFCKAEFNTIQDYCENYFVTKEDASVIGARGYDLSDFFDDFYNNDFFMEYENENFERR